MALTFPNESPEYRAARNALLDREIELKRLAEAVAAERRSLPPGGIVEPYEFSEVGGRKVSLLDLFDERPALVVYSYMFGPERESPCSMCTPLIDGLASVEPHIAQRASLIIVAESPAERLGELAKERGWRTLRVVSAAGTSFNRDYHGKNAKGNDSTMLNVFVRDGEHARHFWGTEMAYAPSDPGQDSRGLDALNPIFQLLDFLPEGRGDFRTKLEY